MSNNEQCFLAAIARGTRTFEEADDTTKSVGTLRQLSQVEFSRTSPPPLRYSYVFDRDPQSSKSHGRQPQSRVRQLRRYQDRLAPFRSGFSNSHACQHRKRVLYRFWIDIAMLSARAGLALQPRRITRRDRCFTGFAAGWTTGSGHNTLAKSRDISANKKRYRDGSRCAQSPRCDHHALAAKETTNSFSCSNDSIVQAWLPGSLAESSASFDG